VDTDPLLIALVVGVFAALLWWPATRSIGRIGVACAAILVFLMSIPALPYAVLQTFANGYRPFSANDMPDARVIVLLGAGTTTVLGRDQDLQVLTPVAASRVLEAARVFRLLNRPSLISSGGVRRPSKANRPSAIGMRDALVSLGVPAERIIVESSSTTTRDEAVIVASMLRTLGVESCVLVTSQSHMPRAQRAFQAQGVRTTPAVAPDYSPNFPDDAGFGRYRPDREGFRLSSALIHEWGGYLYYFWRGWLG
jgi:uncharacterized SAM-binding protein YcdF (DUF218 family)